MQHRLILLLALIMAASFTSCQDSARVTRTINSDMELIARLEKRISVQTKRLTELRRTRSALADITETYEELSDLAYRSKTELSELRSAVSALQSSFEGYETSYRHMTWQNAVGERYPELSKTNGETYTNVKIKQVTPVGIEITHTDGIARIRHTDLDARFQKRFQWKTTEAKAILQKETKAAALVSQEIQLSPKNSTRSRNTSSRNRARNTVAAQRTLARQTRSRTPKRGVNTLKLGKKTGGG